MSKPPKKPTYYIQRRENGKLETVDEVQGYKEAKASVMSTMLQQTLHSTTFPQGLVVAGKRGNNV